MTSCISSFKFKKKLYYSLLVSGQFNILFRTTLLGTLKKSTSVDKMYIVRTEGPVQTIIHHRGE